LGVNIPETVLERITGVPGLSTLVSPQLREDFPALFGHEDTRFDSLAAGFRIADGRLQTQDLTIKSRDFAIDGTGTLGLDLDVDMAATLTTAPALSSRLVSSVTAMRLLANERGVVAIPFRMTGRLPTVKPQPDLSALANVLQRGLLENLGETLRSGAKPKAGPPSTP
jgi:hypothetical protein